MNRWALIVVAVLLLVVAAGAGALIAGGDGNSETTGDDASVLVPFSEPPRFYSSNGQLNVTLTAEEQRILAAGQWVEGRAYYGGGYGGRLLGPTLVIRKPGETLNLNLRNFLNETTNMHYHGFHVSPKLPSDQVVTFKIPAGATYPYSVNVPANHDQGTFWYHSHNHHDSEGQVFGGMSGVALIGEPAIPPGVRIANDRVLALKDFQVRNGEIPKEEIDSNAETIRTVNGLLKPQIAATPGTFELWRLANIGADIFYDVELEGNRFYVIGEDGNAPEKIRAAQHLVLPPGKRYDVLVEFNSPGLYPLKTLTYHTGESGDTYPEVELATVSVVGTAATGEKGRTSLSRQVQLGAQGLPESTGEKVKVLTEEENEKTHVSRFMINGKIFEEGRVDDRVPLGSVEDWTFVNKTGEQHPIHIHQDDFWVIARNGQPVAPISQQDTVIVPPGESVTVRIPFTDFTGKFVYHCHILNHEDNGMMAVIEIPDRRSEGSRSPKPAAHSHSGHSPGNHSH